MSRSAKAKRKGIRRAKGGQKGRRRGTRRQIRASIIGTQLHGRHAAAVPKSAILPTTTLDLPAPDILDTTKPTHLPTTTPLPQQTGTGQITIGKGGQTSFMKPKPPQIWRHASSAAKRLWANHRKRLKYANTPMPNRKRPKIPKRQMRSQIGDFALTIPAPILARERARRNTNRVTIKRRWTLIFTGRRDAIRDRGIILV